MKLVVGIAGTALIADAAYRLVRSPLLSDLGSRTAGVMAANGISDGRANWISPAGWTSRSARLSGTADAATRLRTQRAVAALGGVSAAQWEEQIPARAAPARAGRDIAACQSRLDTLAAAGQIGFEPRNTSLLPASQRQLDAIAQALRSCPGVHLNITDHTATAGSATFKLGLSQARAAVLVAALVDRGLPPASITAAGDSGRGRQATDAAQMHRVTLHVTTQDSAR